MSYRIAWFAVYNPIQVQCSWKHCHAMLGLTERACKWVRRCSVRHLIMNTTDPLYYDYLHLTAKVKTGSLIHEVSLCAYRCYCGLIWMITVWHSWGPYLDRRWTSMIRHNILGVLVYDKTTVIIMCVFTS